MHHIPKFEGLTSTTSRIIAISVKMAFFEILKMSRVFECVFVLFLSQNQIVYVLHIYNLSWCVSLQNKELDWFYPVGTGPYKDV